MLKSIELAKELKMQSLLMADYKFLAEQYAENKNFTEAYQYHRLYAVLKDSIFNDEKSKDLGKLEAQHEFNKKEEALKLEQEKERVLAGEDSKRQRLWIALITALAVAVAIIAIVIFRALHITKGQKKLIEEQKVLVDEVNRTIEEKQKEILDSITYAKHIQGAILPSTAALNSNLKDGFLLFKPKDVVSGDFYWMEKANNTVFFAAADCTGHGVPGAMVSVVCSNALSKALLEEGIEDTGKLLDRTRELVIQRFGKSGEEVKDGMDISLCALNTITGEFKWSGANNPLWIIRKGELIEYKPDKQPIGKYADPKPFTTHVIELQPNDTIYIFTDGYADQFGGSRGKKFKNAQLKELVLTNSNKPLEEQKEFLNKAFEDWRGHLEQVNDICIIGIRI